MFHRFFHGHRGCDGRRHHRGGGPFGRGFRGGGGRYFETGDLRLLVLRLIADRPRHGYELIKEIEERTQGAYSPSPGVIYPTLTLLEELGHVSVTAEEGGRKLYAITAEGETALAARRAEADALIARMEVGAGERPGIGTGLQAVRAVHGLKSALRSRLSRGPLTEEQARTIIAAIEEATAKIERS